MDKSNKNANRPRGGATPKCPVCGTRTMVVDTRSGPDNTIVRQRRCRNDACRETFKTQEAPARG